MSGTPPFLWRRESPRCKSLALRGVLLVMAAAASAGAAADELLAMGGEEQFFGELPVVLSVTRLPQTPLELPAAMTVIDRRMIDASGVNDIPELLRLVAGYQIAHLDGTRYAVTYHGLGDEYARRIQVLVDGRSVYMPATSSVDWLDLPLAIEDIDRIEVLRGPNGVAFGDNSFTGVINIITQEAKTARGSYIKVQGGQGNYRRYLVRQGEKLGDLDLRLTLEHQSDNGFDDAIKKNGTFSSIKDDKLSNKVSLRGDWRAGVNDYVQLHAGLNSGDRGFGYNPYTENQGDYMVEPAFDAQNQRHFVQLKWRHLLSSDNELQLQAHHTRSDTQARYTLQGPYYPIVNDLDTRSDRYDVELEHRLRLSESLRMVWGGELRKDSVVAPGYLNSTDPVENRMTRLFAHSEWTPVSDYLVNAGIMLENNDIAGTHWSPRVAVNRRLSQDHAMRMSYTRAYRTPAILEEYSDYSATLNGFPVYQYWKSDGGLQSEKMTSYEIGLMGNLGDSHTQYDVKLFEEKLRDIISHPLCIDCYPSPLLASTETVVFLNRDWADLRGVEGQLKAYASNDTMFTFGYSYLRGEGSYLKRTYNTGSQNDQLDSVVANVPTHTFSWLAEQRFDSNWLGSLAFYHVDHIDFWHETSVSTVDMRVARRFKRGQDEGEVTLVARDIFGAYYDFQDERVVSPRVYLSLGYRF